MQRTTWNRLSLLLLTAIPLAALSMHAQVGIAPVAQKSGQRIVSAPVAGKKSSAVTPGGPVANAVVTGNGIEYHGGSVIAQPNVYFIWYGKWDGDSALTILPQFISDVSGSTYANINSLYTDNNSNSISFNIGFGGQIFDAYSQGAALGAGGVTTVVTNAVSGGSLPSDPNGVYFVLTSPDVTESNGSGSFCTDYCGYHTATAVNGVDIKYAFVGNASTQCFNDPAVQTTCATHNRTVSPNGNPGADAMASVLAHELNEAASDPDLDAWFHNDLAGENGDLCNFNYGANVVTDGNGADSNITLSGRSYLIQQNWLNANGGSCAMSYATTVGFDPVFYLSFYPDLQAAFGNDQDAAWNHWMNNGAAEGRRPSRQFDPVFYLTQNPDLLAAFGAGNYLAAYNHWISNGLKEGRRASREFDSSTYLLYNGDLSVTFGSDFSAALNHWLTFGLNEGRRTSREFDVGFYLSNSPDLVTALGAGNFPAAFDHWLSNGLSEGRQSAFEFDVNFYLNQNPDLLAAFGAGNFDAAYTHFIAAGLNEGRASSATFDVGFYLSNNPDLIAAFGANNFPAAFDHWVTNGRAEGRKGTP